MKNKRGNEFKQHWFSTAKKWVHVRIILLQETIWVFCSSSAVFYLESLFYLEAVV